MSGHAVAQTQKQNNPPVNTGILQRKTCSCGRPITGNGECAECRKKRVSLQRRAVNQSRPEVAPPIVHEVLRSPGRPLDSTTRSFMESRFNYDFGRVPLMAIGDGSQPPLTINHSGDKYERQADLVANQVTHNTPVLDQDTTSDFSEVRIHTDLRAAKSAQAVSALAYTVGRHVVFGAGQYKPESSEGKRLLAHELQHVVQQSGSEASVQRQHVADTGFRYTMPSSVTRSIVEIQGIVGTNPDGVYGENTRRAVEKYQRKLKDVGFYSDTLDGKWGDNTEAAHVAFALAPNVERRGYNCAGFAFKDYNFHGLAATKAIYSSMTKLASCADDCSPFFHKFWLWEFDLQTTDLLTGAKSPKLPDFHTVGGQTDKDGKGPDMVMSKNGQRPVEGPKPPLDWELKTGPAPHPITGIPSPRFHWTVSGTKLSCFCNDKLP